MKKVIPFCFALILLNLWNVASGQVQLSLQIPNLGSPYLSNYIGSQSNRVLIITNQTGQSRQIFLRGKIEQLNQPGYYLRTKEDFRPNIPISLGPFETKTLFATSSDWAFIESNQLEDNIPGPQKRIIQVSGILPEGEYQICVQAFDFTSGQPVSPDEPVGCQFFMVTLGTPPQIMTPFCDDTLTQEYPLITWTPAILAGALPAVQYDLYVVELVSPALNPQEVMEQSILYKGGNPFVVENLRTTFYQFLPGDPPLKKGAKYAMCVVARDTRSSAMFENQGRSEICLINIGDTRNIAAVPTTQIGSVGISPEVFQLLPQSSISGKLKYKFYGDVGNTVISSELVSGLNLMQLMPGQNIQNQGYAGGGSPTISAQSSMGNYNSMVNAGFNNALFEAPPPPQYILPANYSTGGGRPLPQARIKFTARYAVGKTPNIQHPEDLEFISGMGYDIRVTGPGLPEMLTFQHPTKVVASTVTDNDGNYNVSFFADETFGMIHAGPVDVQWGGGEFPAGAEGYGFYRVITMEVEEKWYCHPDIVMFLQPGQSLDAPTQIVLVQSYNLQLTILSNDKALQFAGPNGPIPNAVVKIGRSKHTSEQMPACFPHNEIKIEDFSPMMMGSPVANYMVGDTGMTDINGKITFHRLVKHDGSGGCGNMFGGNEWPQDGYYIQAGTHPTIGQFHYHTENKKQVAPCNARLPFMCPGNDCAPRSADYIPPMITEEIKLLPLLPKIYANSRVLYNNVPYELPNTTLLMNVFHPDGTYRLAIYKTDAKGLFSKQFTYPQDFYDKLIASTSAGDLTTGYVMDYFKSGFKRHACNTCGTLNNKQYLQYGQKWLLEPTLLPGSHVKGIVEDEHGQAIYGDVKIGDGPYLPLEMSWQIAQGVNANNAGQPFNVQAVVSGIQPQPTQQNIVQQGGVSAGSGNVSQVGGMQVVQNGGIAINPNFEQKSMFSQAAQNGQQIPLIIRPDASNYLPDTFYVNIPSGHEPPGFDLGTFVIKEALHRPRIIVKRELQIFNQQQQVQTILQPVENAEVILSNFPVRMTDSEGAVEYKFGSSSEEFRLRIHKSGYVPYDQYVVIPVTKDLFEIEIILEPGKTITGTVTRASGGQPIADARVYAEIGSNNYGPILIETHTDANGNYTLEGLPKGQVQIKAAKSDPDVTYIGQTKTINTLQTTTCDFQLQEAPFNMATIWNLPVDLESVTPSGNNWIVNGAFVELPENARFKPENETQRLPFSGVTVKTIGAPESNGKYKAEPVQTFIKSNTTKFRSILNDAHIVEMSGPTSSGLQTIFEYNPNYRSVSIAKIRIEKDGNDNGHVKTRTFSLLEYFRISYNYDGQFYLGETSNNAVISAYKGSLDNSMPVTYFLMDHIFQTNQAANPQFKVHNFDAFCDRTESYVREDSFVLSTKLIVDLPQSNPDKLTVSTGNVIVLPNQIIVNSGNQPLEFDLETWHVKTGPWHFDQYQGGLVTSGVITTNLLELPAPHILIKPTSLKLPPASQINLNQLTLGGVLDLDMHPGAKLNFDYVNNPMHDPGTGHWRVVLTHQQLNQPVASISGLPGWPNQTEIDIVYIENFSDGFEKVTMAPNQVVNHYNVINQTVSNIFFAEGGVSLSGNTDLDIPNLPDGYSANFTYYEDQSEIKVRVQGLFTKFETAGQVEFQGDQQHDRIKLSWNHFEVVGGLTIYDDLSSNEIHLRAKLIKEPNNIRIKIIDVDAQGILEGNNKQIIVMGGGSNGNKRVLQGEQKVVQNAWDYLGYQAQFEGYGGSFQNGEDLMWFKVTGALTNDESKGDEVKLANIETPFGDFVLTLDFGEMAIVGDLRVANIPMGGVNIIEGVINMRMGGLGFYLVAHLRAIYPMIGELNTNFITGYYPHIAPEAKQILRQGMYIQKLPAFLEQSGIQGLYVCANKPFFTVDWEVDLGIFGIGIYANAGVDVRFWLNFGQQYGGAYLGGLAYADFELYAHVLGICEMCIGLMAELGFEAEYQWVPNTEFDISICGSITFSVSFCGTSFDESAKLILGWNSSSNDVYYDAILGETCSGNAETGGGGCKHF